MANSWRLDTNFWAESFVRTGRTPSLQNPETEVHCRRHRRCPRDGPRSARARTDSVESADAGVIHPIGHRRFRRGGTGRGTCGDSTGPAKRIAWFAGAFWESWRRMTFFRVYHSTPPTCETSRITSIDQDITVESIGHSPPLPESSLTTDSSVAMRLLDIWHPVSQRKPSCLTARKLPSGFR